MKTAQPIVAKVFKSGNSTAIRMPRSIKLKAKSYIVEDLGGSFRLGRSRPTKPSASRP